MTHPAFASVVLISTIFVPTVVAQTSTAVTFDYATVAYPGAILTLVSGINNSNVVVGSYFDSADVVHGFVYRKGKFSAVNFPGATATQVMGINDFDDIVGMYQVSGPLNFHGFIRHDGVFTRIDDPQASFGTIAFGINKYGEIVGSYDNSHGFVFKNGAYRTLDAPQLPGEPSNTQLNGVNNLGWIAGQVFTGGIWRGFWLVGNDFDFVEAAGADDSQVTGINGHSDIVGCHDSQAGFVSFAVETTESSERSEQFPVQHSLASCPAAINYARVIVGNYFTTKRPNGFLAVPALTLKLSSPTNHSTHSNPVQFTATAVGLNSIVQIEIWVNYKEVFHIKGNSLNKSVDLPVGSNERLVVEAVDSKGLTAKILEAINVQ